MSAAGGRHQLRELVLYGVVGAVGLWFAFQPTLASGFSRLQVDRGDTLHIAYLLEHGFRSLFQRGYVGSLWSPPFLYPDRNVLSYSETMLGALPVYTLVRAVVHDPLLAFQVWMMAALALTFVSTIALLRWLGIRPLVAAAGGYVYAFGMTRVAHLNHPQLLSNFCAPIAVIGLVAWRTRRDPRGLPVAVAALGGQTLASFYLGWFLAAALGVLTLLLRPTPAPPSVPGERPSRLRAVLITAALGLALAALLWPYLDAFRRVGTRAMDVVAIFLPHPIEWLLPVPGTIYDWLLQGRKTPPPVAWEHAVGCGPLIWMGALWGFRRLRGDRLGRAFLVASTLVAACATIVTIPGGQGLSPWFGIAALVPGAAAMRAIGRVWTASTLLLLVGVGLALENWLREAAPSRARVAAWLLLPLLVLEQRVFYLASFPKSIFESRVEQIVARIPPACSSVLVQLSPDRPFYMSQLEGMWAGMLANVPVVNGYTSNFPPGYPDPSQPYRARDVAVWLASRGENRPPCVLGKLVGNP